MVCPEKVELVAHYSPAALAYSQSATELHSQVGILAKADYQRLQDAVEIARLRAEAARLELHRHIAEHRC